MPENKKINEQYVTDFFFGLLYLSQDVQNRENLYVQIAPPKIRSSYLFLSHLNGRFVTICCVVLGAAFGYAAAQKERADANAPVEEVSFYVQPYYSSSS